MALSGKGIFIWRIRACEAGDVNAIANLAQAAGFSHVLVKVADGNFSYNIDTKTGADLAAALTTALKEKNIQVYGWHYVYGYDPKTEADRAIQRVQQLGLDGYVINAEVEYKDHPREARLFMDRLRAGLPALPIGLSSYRFPALHPRLPWKEFLLKCDFNMPQLYWINARNPRDQLKRCLTSFQKIAPFRPLIPTGSLFRQGDWMPTIEEIDQMIRTARENNMPAVNFWEWSNARRYLPEVWNWYAGYDWATGDNIGNDISQKYITALDLEDMEKLIGLYRQDAVYVTHAQAIQGIPQIKGYFEKLLHEVLPQGTFTLTSFTGKGSARFFTWTASSSTGKVHDGSDTIGLVKDKIAYHYSDFSVS